MIRLKGEMGGAYKQTTYCSDGLDELILNTEFDMVEFTYDIKIYEKKGSE